MERLHRARDFQQLQRTGRRVSSRHLSLLSGPGAVAPGRARSPQTSEAALRLAIVTGKRVGAAVVRNRVRRRLRELLRELLPAVSGSQDLVFYARPSAAEATFAELRLDLQDLLRRAGLLTEPAAYLRPRRSPPGVDAGRRRAQPATAPRAPREAGPGVTR